MIFSISSILVASTLLLAGHPFEPPVAADPDEPVVEDTATVEITPELAGSLASETGGRSPVGPRLILLLCETSGPLGGRDPLEAPFFQRPQPIRSIEVDLAATREDTIWRLGDDVEEVVGVPDRLDDLKGEFAVRAVLDLGRSRGHDAPGNLVSDLVIVDFEPNRADDLVLRLDRRLETRPLPELDDVVWVEIPSPMLSRALGRPVFHRAGVVLPPGYHDLAHPRRFWPTLYEIPAFGGDHRDAEAWTRLRNRAGDPELSPPAVIVVLDPNDPLGHHGFVDGDNTGPRATALVEEFLPWLEKRFRLVSDPRGRMLHGHSSGAWSSIWLQMKRPDIFGACFASAPDPVDFSAFQTIDLRTSENLWTTEDGEPVPSYRRPLGPDLDRILMTVAEEMAMERALAPDGTSGEQWSAWNAMFSGHDPSTGRPRLAFDLSDGSIDRTTILRDWSRFDIANLVRADPERYAPIFRERIRILCGARDSFFLDEAVRRLAAILDEVSPRKGGPGYIEIIEEATHDTVVGPAMTRWLPEMKAIAEAAPGG